MRNKKRIPIVINNPWLMSFVHETGNFTIEEALEITEKLAPKKDEIKKIWNKNPDMRFGQLLINYFNVPESDRLWYAEEVDWLIDNNYAKVEDICFWGVNFKKDNTPRKYPKQVLLRDLKTDHIANILTFFERNGGNIKANYLEYFNKRLNI